MSDSTKTYGVCQDCKFNDEGFCSHPSVGALTPAEDGIDADGAELEVQDNFGCVHFEEGE